MIEIGTLKHFDSGTYRAAVQLPTSLTTYFEDVPVARNIPTEQMLANRRVIVAVPHDNLKDAVVIAVFTS